MFVTKSAKTLRLKNLSKFLSKVKQTLFGVCFALFMEVREKVFLKAFEKDLFVFAKLYTISRFSLFKRRARQKR